MIRHLACSLTILAAINGQTLSASELAPYDAGFLMGFRAATTMLTEFTEGSGDSEYHCGTYSFRLSLGTKVATNLEQEIPKIRNRWLATSLTEMARDIRAASPDGQGDVHYWVGMLKRQYGQLKRVYDRRETLHAEMLTDVSVTDEHELGFLRGLRVATNSLVSDMKTRGNMNYFIRLFVIQREAANLVAREIESGAKSVTNSVLRLTLTELAKDLRSAPQDGNGNLDYWTGDIRTHQRRVLRRVNEKLGAFVDLVASEFPSCDQPLRTEGIDHGVNLKEI